MRSSSPTKPAIVTILANIKTLAKVKKGLKPNLQENKIHYGFLAKYIDVHQYRISFFEMFMSIFLYYS